MSERALSGEVTVRRGRIDEVEVALIQLSDQLIFALVAEDRDPLSQESLDEASEQAAGRLREVLRTRAEQRKWPILLRATGESVLAALLLLLLFYGLSKLRKGWRQRLFSSRFSRKARLFELDFGSQAARLSLATLELLVRLLLLVALYVWATFVLSRFSYTHPWAEALGHWLLSTLVTFGRAVVQALPGLGTVVLIFFVARALTGILSGMLARIEKGSLAVSWLPSEVAKGSRRIAVLLVWLFAVAIAYPFIPGSSLGAFQGVSVLLGLMVTLGSASLLNHVLAGWVILFTRGVQVGDYVRIGEHEGELLQLGVLSIKLLTRHQEELTLPNAVATGNVLTNFSRRAETGSSLATTVLTIGYDAPWRQVQALLRQAAELTPGVRTDRPIQVLQRALSDFFVEYELVVEVAVADRPQILSELYGNIQDAFNEQGVQIMSPHFKQQPEEAVVVPKDRWYSAPAKRPDHER